MLWFIVLAQTDFALEAKAWDVLFSSSPFRLIFGAFLAGMFVLILNSFTTNRAYNKLLTASADREKTQAQALTDMSRVLFALKDTLANIADNSDDNYTTHRQAIEQLAVRVNSVLKASGDSSSAIAEIILEAANLHAETRRFLKEGIHLELIDLVQRIYAQRGAALVGQIFTFPDADDCRWFLALIKPVFADHTAGLYSMPILEDNTSIGTLEPEGRVAYVIQRSSIAGWVMIWDKMTDPELKAWVQSPYVSIEKLPHKESRHEQT